MSNLTKSISAIFGRARIIAFLPVLLLLALACTTLDQQMIEGILQDVDSANGEITIVTKDGKTITLTISTDASVETEGTSSSFETLEPGVAIEVTVTEDGEHAHKISARQSKVHGTVISVEGNEVSIQSGDGSVFVVIVDESTRIKLEEDWAGTLAEISVGTDIEVKFDPETGVAFKLDLEQEEAEIEGWVENIEGDQVTIRTKHGRLLTVTVGENARIELVDDWPGTVADIVAGLKIEVDFDPSSLAAYKIELEQDEAEIEGWVVKIEGDQVTIRTENGYEMTVTIGEDTQIELDDDWAGAVTDIMVGLKIELDFDPSSLAAYKIEIEQEKDEVEGWVENIEGDQVTIRGENGSMLTVTVGENTRIEMADDFPGTLADITVGLKIELDFDPSSLAAYKIEIEQEKDEVEGWVENIEGDQVTIRGENGSMLTVTVGENTRIELDDDLPGTLTDIVGGLKIEVDFDPSSLAAYKIEIDH